MSVKQTFFGSAVRSVVTTLGGLAVSLLAIWQVGVPIVEWIHPASAASAQHETLADETGRNTNEVKKSNLRFVNAKITALDEAIIVTEFRADLNEQAKAKLIASYRRQIKNWENVIKCLNNNERDCFER